MALPTETAYSTQYATPARTGKKRSALPGLLGILLVLVILGSFLGSLTRTNVPPKQQDTTEQKPSVQKGPDLTTQQVAKILFKHYLPSLNMLNAGVDVNSGSWRSFREGPTENCESDGCYYIEYTFHIVDAQGSAHEVECEWDVDAIKRTAVPRNEQARYYWTSTSRPDWNR